MSMHVESLTSLTKLGEFQKLRFFISSQVTNACDGYLHAVVLCSATDLLKSLSHQRYQGQKAQARHSARHVTTSEELRLCIVVAVCERLQMIVFISMDVTQGVALA
jgi:hypothetical protein